ncbi:50S ribosomal protein L10 [Chloroflexota bacterium]
MSRERNSEIIDTVKEEFSKCNIIILTDYRGLTNSEITNLRRRLQKSETEYKVVKNTLARFAAEKAGKDELINSFKGPTAIALGYGDIAAPAKVLADYIHESEDSISIKGGLLDDKLISSAQVIKLSTLPLKEILLAQVTGQMMSPISTLLSYLTSPISGMIGLLQARINQLEGE